MPLSGSAGSRPCNHHPTTPRRNDGVLVQLSAAGDVPFTRAVGTARLARDFCVAAAAQDHDKNPPSLVAHFLYGHALELAFKAILIVHGTTDRALRGIGHDLAQAREAAVRVAPHGTIPMDDRDIARIDLLTAYYEAKALEYVEPGSMRLPILSELRDTSEKLVIAIQAYVEGTIRGRLRADRAV
jgi:hypothetical protein